MTTSGSDQFAMLMERFVSAGYPVIPIGRDKRPRIPGETREQRAWSPYRTRLPTPEQLGAWFAPGQTEAAAMILGRLAGKAAGGGYLTVIDLESMTDALGLLAAVPEQAAAPMARTPGGPGAHIYVRSAAPIGNREIELVDPFTGLVEHVGDIKGEGGYVLVPPSVHPAPADELRPLYEWINGRALPELSGLVPLVGGVEQVEEWLGRIGFRLHDRMAATLAEDGEWKPAASLDELLAVLPGEGSRHTHLVRLVGKMRAMDLPMAQAVALLDRWNGQLALPLPDAEVMQTIEDGYARWRPTQYTPVDLSGIVGLDPATGEAPAKRRRWEIIDAPDYADRPPPPWLVDGIFTVGGLGAIIGQPGSYKSFVALGMGMAVACGERWLDRETRQGSVLYVCAEGAGGFGLRMRAWAKHHGRALPRSFKVLPGVVPLLDAEAVRELVDQIEAIGEPFSLVMFDTLSRSTPGADENSAQDMTRLIAAAELLQQRLGCSVVLIHHNRKADNTIRGHSSLMGALDTAITLVGVERGEAVVLECSKQKDAEPFPNLVLKPLIVSLTDDPDVPLGSVVMETPEQAKAEQVLSEREAAAIKGNEKNNKVLAELYARHGTGGFLGFDVNKVGEEVAAWAEYADGGRGVRKKFYDWIKSARLCEEIGGRWYFTLRGRTYLGVHGERTVSHRYQDVGIETDGNGASVAFRSSPPLGGERSETAPTAETTRLRRLLDDA